jgi:hypothetical protein
LQSDLRLARAGVDVGNVAESNLAERESSPQIVQKSPLRSYFVFFY